MENKMPGRARVVGAVLATVTLSSSIGAALTAPALDYEYFKSRVEPVFLTKRPDHARCYVCHVESNNAFHLERLAAGAQRLAEGKITRHLEMSSILGHPSAPD